MHKIALITGGTSGIGLAIARILSQNNIIVYAAGRNLPDIKLNEQLIFSFADVTKSETIKKLIDEIITKHNRIDILINCAGIGVAAAIEEIPDEDVLHAFDINYIGTLRAIKAVVPGMRLNKSGLIINISSIAGLVGLPFQGIYSSTKFAIEGMSEALSIELKPFGINVCIIEPGDYKTNVSVNRKVVRPSANSPYYERLHGFFERLNSNIEKGADPDKIGKLVLKITQSKKPKLRYKTGRLLETITPVSQKIIPARIFEKLLAGFYKL